MELYFLRHGSAEAAGERPLSEEGRQEMRRVAKRIQEYGLGLAAIYTSPLSRASQTAEIVGEAVGIAPIVTDTLEANANLQGLAELLARAAPDAKVMLVGHEPDFSATVGALIGGGSVEMKKAGLARVECDRIAPGGGTLRWLLTPKVMGA